MDFEILEEKKVDVDEILNSKAGQLSVNKYDDGIVLSLVNSGINKVTDKLSTKYVCEIIDNLKEKGKEEVADFLSIKLKNEL